MEDQTSAADYVRAALAPESDIGDVSPDVVQQLLAEHDAWRTHFESAAADCNRWRDLARIRASQRDEASDERDQLRARLAAADTEQAEHAARIGTVRVEWGTEFDLIGGRTRIVGPLVEAPEPGWDRSGDGWRYVTRVVGQWRPAEPPACRSCGTTERVQGTPPLCTNCVVYGTGLPLTVVGVTAAPGASLAASRVAGAPIPRTGVPIPAVGQTEPEPYRRPSYCRCAPLPDGPGDRDANVWCWEPNPNGPLRCGLLANHPGKHKRGEREWGNDAGQDATKENTT